MSRLCSVCSHPQRQAIDLALMEHAAGYRRIAARFGLAQTSLRRHEAAHLRQSLQQSKELRMSLSADNLTEQLGKWHARMQRQYRKADAAGDIHAAVATARTGIAAIESFSKIAALGELEQRVGALEAEQAKDNPDDRTR